MCSQKNQTYIPHFKHLHYETSWHEEDLRQENVINHTEVFSDFVEELNWTSVLNANRTNLRASRHKRWHIQVKGYHTYHHLQSVLSHTSCRKPIQWITWLMIKLANITQDYLQSTIHTHNDRREKSLQSITISHLWSIHRTMQKLQYICCSWQMTKYYGQILHSSN